MEKCSDPQQTKLKFSKVAPINFLKQKNARLIYINGLPFNITQLKNFKDMTKAGVK